MRAQGRLDHRGGGQEPLRPGRTGPALSPRRAAGCIETGLDDFVRRARASQSVSPPALGEHELSPLLLELAEDAMARVRLPTAHRSTWSAA